MTAHADPVADFLAHRPDLGLDPGVYAAEKQVAAREVCPQLAVRLLDASVCVDEPRERAVEAVLGMAGDLDDLKGAVTVLHGFRPDLDRDEITEWVHTLYSANGFAADERHMGSARREAAELDYLELIGAFLGGAR